MMSYRALYRILYRVSVLSGGGILGNVVIQHDANFGQEKKKEETKENFVKEMRAIGQF